MNILKKTYRKLTNRKYNIGFVENSLEGILQGGRYGWLFANGDAEDLQR